MKARQGKQRRQRRAGREGYRLSERGKPKRGKPMGPRPRGTVRVKHVGSLLGLAALAVGSVTMVRAMQEPDLQERATELVYALEAGGEGLEPETLVDLVEAGYGRMPALQQEGTILTLVRNSPDSLRYLVLGEGYRTLPGDARLAFLEDSLELLDPTQATALYGTMIPRLPGEDQGRLTENLLATLPGYMRADILERYDQPGPVESIWDSIKNTFWGEE